MWPVLIVLDGSGGWVASFMVLVGRKKRRGNFWAMPAIFEMTGSEGGMYIHFVSCITVECRWNSNEFHVELTRAVLTANIDAMDSTWNC